MSNAIARTEADATSLVVDESVPKQETLQRKTAVVVATGAGMLAVLLLVWTARAALLLIFAGIILAIPLRAATRYVERKTKLSSGWALALLLLGFVIIVTFCLWLRGAEIASQVDQLQQKLPSAFRQVTATLPNFALGRWLIRHGADPQQFPRFVDVLPKITGFLSNTLGLIVGLLLVVYVGICVAAEPQTYRRGIERLFAPEKRLRVGQILNQIEVTLRRWMLARAVSMGGVGLLVTIGLSILHVPLAGTLGLFAAAMTFIPNLGPVLSVIPPALLAFVSSPKVALLVLILFGAVHLVEGWFLTPVVERTIVRLPPVLTLSMQLLLAVVAGAIGVAMAAPVTVLLVVLVRTSYVERIEDESSQPQLTFKKIDSVPARLARPS